jgi:hypothetical protein
MIEKLPYDYLNQPFHLDSIYYKKLEKILLDLDIDGLAALLYAQGRLGEDIVPLGLVLTTLHKLRLSKCYYYVIPEPLQAISREWLATNGFTPKGVDDETH